MDVQAELNRGTEGALSLLAEKQHEAVFNELLEYASEATLVNPPSFLAPGEVSKYDTVTGEGKIVQTMGARSLAVLLEMKDGLHDFSDVEPKLDEKGEPIDFFTPADLLALPERFSLTPNNRILENAERFGQALIDESFAILGTDADKWVEKLRNAQTLIEELQVIDWLNARILDISDKSRSESSVEDEAAHFYPPFRLSPKFIGSYPKLNLQPSCLSSSIIATSFFEKAAMPVMHAGVTTPASDAGTHLLVNMMDSMAKDFLSDTPSEASEEQARKLVPVLKASREWKERPLAQHGAVYVELKHGSWVQFDPYGNATVELLSEENTHLKALHGKLDDWKDIVPNLEFTTSALPDRGMQLVSPEYAALSYTLDSFEYSDDERAELVAKIDTFLKDIPSEASITYLYETCFKLITDKKYFDKNNEAHAAVMQTILDSASEDRKTAGHYDSRMARVFDAAIREFVRWDATPEAFIERCATDDAYRTRRANDFLSVPTMMSILNAQVTAQESPGIAHLSVDIGNPAMRIGLATLSDFAVYDDNPLPPQFWVTHWPGMVSILENLEVEPTSDTDWILLFNNLLYQQVHPFTSTHNYDKINSFLSAHTEEKNDGNEQEGPGRADREVGGR